MLAKPKIGAPTKKKLQDNLERIRRRASARVVTFRISFGGQFTLSTQLIKPNYLVILPPTQHHSFFRNLPPLKKLTWVGASDPITTTF